jgi:precorrin-6Y C5,15-methyltransferase (decarboxylating)
MKYIVIGISDNPAFILIDEIKALLPLHTTFSGGTRHYELIKQHLPANHTWLDIKGDMQHLFDQYSKHNTIVVFASGDPLFYGFANTIAKYHPQSSIKVYPHFNSLQVLCHKCNISYQPLHNTSVHGRSWDELDISLINQKALIGVLTDAVKTPAKIAQRMLDYGFNNYRLIIGEALEGPLENIRQLSLKEATTASFQPLNCVLLIQTQNKPKTFGIPDDQFAGLPNRPNMITKMPIRLISLSQLNLNNYKTFWDIGFCTGAVSIEAKKQFPHLQITAFEKRPECDELFEINTHKHATPGISKVMGDIFEQTLPTKVESVFIGGHGNRLQDLINLIDKHLVPKGRIVINAVKAESKEQFITGIQQLNYRLLEPIVITVDEHNPITILTAEKE